MSDNRYIVKSAPASQQTSPIVGRSKSLRLPRKQYVGLESNSASRLEPQAGKFSRGNPSHAHVGSVSKKINGMYMYRYTAKLQVHIHT